MKDILDVLKKKSVALLTRHGKQTLLGPLLETTLGCPVVHVDSIDTDTLGTFTREVARAGSQRDAARQKAMLGATVAQCRFGLASEGVFGSDPWTGLMPWNIEMVLLRDNETGLEIAGMGQGAAMNHQQLVKDETALLAFAKRAGFPAHQLVMRPDHADHPQLIKGIATDAALRAAFEESLRRSEQGCVFVENDLRAHTNPTRQTIIVEAASNLLARLASSCPQCQSPDFWTVDVIRGLPCRACDTPTGLIQAEKWACPQCRHEHIRRREGDAHADPSRCPQCNP